MILSNTQVKTLAMLGSCGAFGMAALDLAEQFDDVLILTADLTSFSGLQRFKAKYSDRLMNVGVAEQNLIGIAAGLAKEGYNVFATTYATFATTRCCDQVRVNMGYMNLNMKLVGLTAGLSVGILGSTHMSIEDIAIMRSIPNIMVLSPADCTETVKATMAAAAHHGPVYLRLSGGMSNPIVYGEDYDFEIGKAITLRNGADVAVIATGTMVYQALEAAKLLVEQGISSSVIDMHTIKPLDTEAVLESTAAKLIVTVEEHNVVGGLGGAVAECLACVSSKPPQLMIGIPDRFPHAADYRRLLELNGLTPQQIAQSILDKYKAVERHG